MTLGPRAYNPVYCSAASTAVRRSLLHATYASRWSLALAPLLAVACSDATPPAATPDAGVAQPPATVTYNPPEPVLRRLTKGQYVNAIHDLLGDDLLVTRPMEPDVPLGGSVSVGAARPSISRRGVEQYEALAYDLAEQLLRTETRRARAVGCTPTGTADATCAETFLRATGRRLWRRPLTVDELNALVTLAGNAATTLNDFHRGLEYALAAMLQSPHFLFRAELAEPASGSGTARFSPYSLASRLAFFLWNSPPDDPSQPSHRLSDRNRFRLWRHLQHGRPSGGPTRHLSLNGRARRRAMRTTGR